jgi:subtilisin family serine protease
MVCARLLLLTACLVVSACRPPAPPLRLTDVPVVRSAPAEPEAKLPEAFRETLRTADRSLRVLVDLDEQVDLARLTRALSGSRRQRGERVIAALAEVAGRSQARLVPFLEETRRQGLVLSWQGFTVVNRLLVEATPAGIAALAQRSEVVSIVPEIRLPEPVLAGGGALPDTPERTSWAVAATGAPAAWTKGLDGTGVVVGAVDSGASAVHEQLAAGFRGGERSWLDPASGSIAPRDTRFGHGTGVLSCAVGRNVGGITLGIAPGAQWIACAALPEGHYDNVLLTRCADWMLNVGRPNVLVVAWVLPTTGCDRSLLPIVEAWRAAGILPVFAAGNHGPGERTDRSPANYPHVLSVGGLTRDGSAFAETSRGPTECGAGVFPRLAAPAEDLIAAFPLARDTYLRAKGTSFAAGIAAGAAAILVQSHPEATVPQLEEALAQDGRLDVPGALQRLADLTGSSRAPAARFSGTPGRSSARSPSP